MSTIDLLKDLALDGWRFWLDEGRLRYRAPKEAATEAVLAELKDQKEAIIDVLRNTPDALDISPLSYGQRALWFLWALSPASSAYNLSLPIRLRGDVDVDAWREVCCRLLQRHPTLRTTFPRRHDEPIQQVSRSTEPDFCLIDASSLDDAAMTSAMVAAHNEPFDLERGPVARFRLFTRGPSDHRLLMTMHHIVSDGWSLQIIVREVAALYDSVKNGKELPVPPEYTYADYVRWQRGMLASPEGERLWAYWSEQLAPPLPAMNLPTDRPRPATQTYNGGSYAFAIDDALVQGINALAQKENATPFLLFLAVFDWLLQPYTEQGDLVIGTPVAKRDRPELARVVGYFVDPIAIRMKASDDQPFSEFLTGVRETMRQAWAHSDFPFALLVEKLRIERDPSRSPIFDVTFNFHSLAGAERNAPDLEVIELPQADGKFDLTLNITEHASSMTAAFGYNSDLFDRQTMARFAQEFVEILECVIENPEVRRSELWCEEIAEPVLKGRVLV